MKKRIAAIIILLIIFFPSLPAGAEDFKYAEIFDPKKDAVVKVVQMTPEINAMVTDWIMKIKDFYKNDPATDDGYAVRIPITPEVKINSRVLNGSINEVYIIIPEKEPPCFMIFENANKLNSYPFTGDIKLLSKSLGFKLGK